MDWLTVVSPSPAASMTWKWISAVMTGWSLVLSVMVTVGEGFEVDGRPCAVVDGDVVGEGDGFTDGEEVEIEIAVEGPIAVAGVDGEEVESVGHRTRCSGEGVLGASWPTGPGGQQLLCEGFQRRREVLLVTVNIETVASTVSRR